MNRNIKEVPTVQALNAAALARWLGLPGVGVETREEVDSTNLRLKEGARQGLIRAPYLLAAGRQTAGRGRLGRRFVSPEGGLYLSLLASPPEGGGPEAVTLLSAVAVCRAIEEMTPLKTRIKWVNDIFVGNKKVSGILAERIEAGVIVGIGVNLQTPPGGFPPEAGIAGALDVPADANALAGRIAALIFKGLEAPNDPAILSEYRQRMFLTGQWVSYQEAGREYRGLVLGVSPDGGLIVSRDGEERVLRSGEVTVGSHLVSRLE